MKSNKNNTNYNNNNNFKENSHIFNNNKNSYNNIKYSGPSPDEITLVETAKEFGFVFLGASSDLIEVEF